MKEPYESCAREDCRIQILGGFSTLMAWTPTFDKHGKQLDSDPNTRVTEKRCITCGAKWAIKTRGDKISIEISAPPPSEPLPEKPGQS